MPIDRLNFDQALSAYQAVGGTEWRIMQEYRNADPSTRGNFNAFRQNWWLQNTKPEERQWLISNPGFELVDAQKAVARQQEAISGGQAGGGTGAGGTAPPLSGQQTPGGQPIEHWTQPLQDVAAGQVPGYANLLPSFGAPSFLSPQSISRMTPSEQNVYQTEVKGLGFPWQDWQSQMHQQWGGFGQKPDTLGMGRVSTAPGYIR